MSGHDSPSFVLGGPYLPKVTSTGIERQSVREVGGCRDEVHVVCTPLRCDCHRCVAIRAAARELIDAESHELKEIR